MQDFSTKQVIQDLKGGFHGAGLYSVRRPELDSDGLVGQTVIQYTPSKLSSAPLAIVPHGFRGDAIGGANGQELSRILQAVGFSTAQINNAGNDHYGCQEALRRPDTATITSNAEDIRLTIEAYGSGNPAILIGNSASTNAALLAVMPNVSDVVLVSPVPDFPQLLLRKIWDR